VHGRACSVLVIGLLLVCGQLSCWGPALPGEDAVGETNSSLPIDGPIEIPPDTMDMFSGVGDAFVENLGQLEDGAIRYYTQGAGVSIGLTDDGIIVVMRGAGLDGTGGFTGGHEGARTTHFAVMFDRCNPLHPRGRDAVDRTSSYFLGNDPSGWVRGARAFREVVYEGLWDGIDLVLRLRGDVLKYDILLDAGAAAGAVTFRYEGVDGLSLDANGDLLIQTGAGVLRDTRPVVQQEGVLPPEGAEGRFLLLDRLVVGMALPAACDPGLPVLIDPGMVFSTLLGGAQLDYLTCGALCGDGDIYVGGVTNSTDFPMVGGGYDPVGHVSTGTDGVVMRLNGTGHPKATTFLGGGDDETVNDLGLGDDGSLYAVGDTNSSDFPVTPDAMHGTFMGAMDGFLVRLSPNCTELIHGSYIGGSAYDTVAHVELEEQGSVVISGGTNSSDLATTSGAFCESYEPTDVVLDSVFVMRADGPLTHVMYCTYINGVDSFDNYVTRPAPNLFLPMDIDGAGDIFLASNTNRTSFTTTAGAFMESYAGGLTDVVVMRLHPGGDGGADLVGCTYLGGTDMDLCTSLRLMEDGRVCVGGATHSFDFPLSNDSLQGDSDGTDGFLAVLDGGLEALEFGTYYGGWGSDIITTLARGKGADELIAVGNSGSWDLPVTTGAFDDQIRSGILTNSFIALFNLSTPALKYCTFFGGSGGEAISMIGHGGIADGDGGVICHAATLSRDFPTTLGAYQRSFGGSTDGFLLRLEPTACGPPAPPANLTVRPGNQRATVSWDAHTNVGYRVGSYLLHLGLRQDSMDLVRTMDDSDTRYELTGLTNGRTYYVGLSATSSAGESAMSVVEVRPVGPPSVPRTLVLTSGDGTINASWTPPLDTGGSILGYHVLRGLTDDSLAWVHTTNATTLAYRDRDVTKGLTYWYGIIAFNEGGNSSVAVDNLAPYSLPGPPIDLGLEELDRVVVVTWSAPTDTGGGIIGGYRVYRGDRLDNMSRVIERDSVTLSYRDSSLTNGMRYCYYVTVVTQYNESAPSEVVWAIPYGPPPEPVGLQAIAGELQIGLAWSPPRTDNGRPITNYVVRWGTYPSRLDNEVRIGNTTHHIQAVPENGVAYYFQVAAVNLRGTGLFSEEASAVPMGPMGKLASLRAELVGEGVRLVWEPPVDSGGAKSLTYIVERNGPEPAFREMGQVSDALEFLDNTTVAGGTYTYRVAASTLASVGPFVEVNITVVLPPSMIDTLTATAGDGLIELRWSPPASDGGSGITAYFIIKRGPEGGFVQLTWTLMNNHTDREVVPGSTYTYYVVARNGRYNGTDWREASATAVTHPGPVGNLSLTYTDGAVELSWLPSTKSGAARTTGYIILRGLKASELEPIAEVGPVTFYRDGTVEKGNRYYYQVVAKSDIGPGDPSGVQDIAFGVLGVVKTAYWPLLVALVALVAVGALAVAYRRRVRAAAGAPTVHIVEEVLVVLRDGRLIATAGRDESRSKDADLMSGMLVAIQGIAKEGLERGGTLESIKYEDNTILMVSGPRLNVATVVYGLPDEALRQVLEETVRQLEATYGDIIDGWDGDLSVFAGVGEAVHPLVERTRNVTREDVRASGAAPGETEVPP